MQLWESTTIIKAQEALKQWRSKPKREKLAERRAKKQAKSGIAEKTEKEKILYL